MNDFQPTPTVLRSILNGSVEIVQSGHSVKVGGKSADSVVTANTLLSNPRHYLRDALTSVMPRLENGEVAAIVVAKVNGKTAQILIEAADWAKGADERARYDAWVGGCLAGDRARHAAERNFDLAHNEGGEGYNPLRNGAAATYRR